MPEPTTTQARDNPYANSDWTEIQLSKPVVIGTAVEAIMRRCGGDSFGFGYAQRETSDGLVPLFSVYHTTPRERRDSSKTIYNIDPGVVCTEYVRTRTQRMWVSPSAGLDGDKLQSLRLELTERR